MEFETPNFEENNFTSEQEAQEALESAVKADDAAKAEAALKAMEALKQSKKDKMPEELLNAMKEATEDPNEVNFVRVKKDDILENINGIESQEDLVGFEKVLVNGTEIMLSKKTSEPITYTEALKWCEADGGRMPTIEELQALYNSDKADSFEGKVIWSSSMRLNSPQVFDFSHGRVELRNREDAINATRAVADIN